MAAVVSSEQTLNAQEVEFYRQQCNDLGKRLLRAQEEQRYAHRDAQRARLIAQLVRQTHAATEMLFNRRQLDERYLQAILTITRYDRAVLLQQQSDQSLFRVVSRLGFPQTELDASLELSLLPSQLYCNSRTAAEPPIPEFRAFLELPYFLWVSEPHAKLALLLGNSTESPISPPFESKDLEICATALDVYVHLSRRRQAEEDSGKFSLALQQSSAAVLIADAQGVIEYVNPAFQQLAGSGAGQSLVAQSIDSLQSRYPIAEQYRLLRAAVQNGCEWSGELLVASPDKARWEHTRLTPIRDAEQNITHFLMLSDDISLRKEYEQRLFQQAHYDVLTGLPNRTLAMDRLMQALATARREQHQVAILFLDLDKFKLVNDTLGHLVGDELLVATGKRLKACIRESDTLARLGGDEFLCILPKVGGREVVESVARKLLGAFVGPFVLGVHTLHVSTSIGVALYPADGDEPHTLLRNADAALYEAKDIGRDTYHFFTHRLSKAALERMDLQTRLRHALSRGELSLHYQPIIDLRSGEILGAEALLRWRNPDLGAIPPDRFIPVAEETGLIVAIGEWVLHAACQDAAQWGTLHGRPFQVAVNVSARQVQANTMFANVAAALRASGLSPGCLALEITESLLMDCGAETVDYFRALRVQGVGLAIDDFGTGYSSLSYLQRYPFDKLKIDRAFTQGIGDNPKTTALVRAILAMARNLELKVVAEGIETASQHDFLQAAGCDYGQGYFLGKPLPKAEMTDFLARCRPAPSKTG